MFPICSTPSSALLCLLWAPGGLVSRAPSPRLPCPQVEPRELLAEDRREEDRKVGVFNLWPFSLPFGLGVGAASFRC